LCDFHTNLTDERTLKELVNCPLPMVKPSQILRFSEDWRPLSAVHWMKLLLHWRGWEQRTITTQDKWTSMYWSLPTLSFSTVEC